MWIICAILGLFSGALFSLLSKAILVRKEENDPIAYTVTVFLVVAAICTVVYVITGIQISDFQKLQNPFVLSVLALNFICYTIAPSFFYRALKYLPASEVTILYTLVGIWAMIFGVLFHIETIRLTSIFGAICIIGAVILVSYEKKKWNFNKYTFMLFLATIVYGAAVLTDNIIITDAQMSPLFFQIINFTIPAILIMLVNRRGVSSIIPILKDKTNRAYLLLNGIVFFAMYMFIFYAYSLGGEASSVNIILSGDVILVIIFSALFLKERDRLPVKFVASIIAVIGVLLLK